MFPALRSKLNKDACANPLNNKPYRVVAKNWLLTSSKRLKLLLTVTEDLKIVRGHMMPPPLHVCNGLASSLFCIWFMCSTSVVNDFRSLSVLLWQAHRTVADRGIKISQELNEVNITDFS